MMTQLKSSHPRRGFMMVDLVVAMSLLGMVILPLAYSFVLEADAIHAEYQRGVAMEIVDGEMEILAAGAWRSFPEGTQAYPVDAPAAVNLPAGKFELTRLGNHLKLEWTPEKRRFLGPVIREVTVK